MKLNPEGPEIEHSAIPVIARGLVKRYNNFTAVDGVSFDVKPGECVALLGPNGAGKTTIIKMISCIFPPTEGSLMVFGLETRKHARQVKNMIGVVPQENSLDMDLTVIQNLLVYASYFRIKKEEAMKKAFELLEEFGLKKFERWKILDLSGGLRRRLTIARGFINNPGMLILDEPTTGLDPQTRQFIWEKLEEFKRRGTTMLLTTHYIEEAQRFADRVIIIDRGRILSSGTPEGLIEKHVGTHVVETEKINQQMFQKLKEKLAHENHVEVTRYRIYIFTANPEDVIHFIKQAGFQDYRVRPATLEDVFIKLTGRELRE